MNFKSGMLAVITALLLVNGCAEPEPKYGVERGLNFPARRPEIWAVAPAINLSGYREVDSLLQADLLFAQLQQVNGLTVIPVNRVAEVYASLHMDKVQTPQDVAQVCAILGCDRLVIPTITAYDPYVPPKIGASLQLIGPKQGRSDGARQASARLDTGRSDAGRSDAAPADSEVSIAFVQVVGMYDAANGSVRDALTSYAAGRNDPAGPMGSKEYLASIDRYCGFVYHDLIVQVMQRKSWDEWKR